MWTGDLSHQVHLLFTIVNYCWPEQPLCQLSLCQLPITLQPTLLTSWQGEREGNEASAIPLRRQTSQPSAARIHASRPREESV